jgi:WD40 repeat protein
VSFREGPVRVWDLTRAGAPPVTLSGVSSDSLLAFAPDGRLVTWNHDSIRAWDLAGSVPRSVLLPESRSLNRPGNIATPVQLAFSRGGRLAAGDFSSIRVWDLEHPNVAPIAPPVADEQSDRRATPKSGIRSLTFAPDGRLIAGSDDGTIRFWDLDHLDAPPIVLRAHTQQVDWLGFAPDGRFVSLGYLDREVRIWDLKATSPEALILHNREPVYSAAIDPAGKIALGEDQGMVRIWDIDLDRMVRLAGQVAGRNLSLEEWSNLFPDRPYRRTFADLPDGEGVEARAPSP